MGTTKHGHNPTGITSREVSPTLQSISRSVIEDLSRRWVFKLSASTTIGYTLNRFRARLEVSRMETTIGAFQILDYVGSRVACG